MNDITDILAFEVKKELADRYFGFRRQIETDTAAYIERLTLTSLELENSIGLTLTRCYLILGDKSLITQFLSLTGLPENLYYDPYILESPTIKQRVFSGAERRGITRKGQHINLLLDTYEKLHQQINEYRENLDSLQDEQATIREEINLFYRKNDIDTILTFLRKLDQPSVHQLGSNQPSDPQPDSPTLRDQLRMSPPQAAEKVLPLLPAIPSLSAVKKELKRLGRDAYCRNPEFNLK